MEKRIWLLDSLHGILPVDYLVSGNGRFLGELVYNVKLLRITFEFGIKASRLFCALYRRLERSSTRPQDQQHELCVFKISQL